MNRLLTTLRKQINKQIRTLGDTVESFLLPHPSARFKIDETVHGGIQQTRKGNGRCLREIR